MPITDGMKDGKEPMRTFGDLMQFFQHKNKQQEEPEKPPEQPAESSTENPPTVDSTCESETPPEIKDESTSAENAEPASPEPQNQTNLPDPEQQA
ncbi:MAG: hypothetical protein ACWGMZ_06875 [Thermoguttaceae bacterium]